jgi:transposase
VPLGSGLRRNDEYPPISHTSCQTLETFGRWLEPILNYFRKRTSNGIVEGINHKIKVIKRLAYGFRNFGNFRLRVLAAWWG